MDKPQGLAGLSYEGLTTPVARPAAKRKKRRGQGDVVRMEVKLTLERWHVVTTYLDTTGLFFTEWVNTLIAQEFREKLHLPLP